MAVRYPDYYRPDPLITNGAHEEFPPSAEARQLSNHDVYRYCFAWIRRGWCHLGPQRCKHRHEMPGEDWVRQHLPYIQHYPPRWYLAQDVTRHPATANDGVDQRLVPQKTTMVAQPGSAAGCHVATLPSTTPVDIAPPEDPLAALTTALHTAQQDLPSSAADNNPTRPDTITTTAPPSTVLDTTDTTITVSTGDHHTRKSRSKSKKVGWACSRKISASFDEAGRVTRQRRTKNIADISSICGEDYTTWLPGYATPTEIVAGTAESNPVVLKMAQHWPTMLLELITNLATSTKGDLPTMHACIRQSYDLLPDHRRGIIKGSRTTGALYELMRQACNIASEVARAPSVALGPIVSTYTLRRSRAAPTTDDGCAEEMITRRTTRGLATGRCTSYYPDAYDEDDEEFLPTIDEHDEQQDLKDQIRCDTPEPARKRIKIETDNPLTPALTRLSTFSERSGPITEQGLSRDLSAPNPIPIPMSLAPQQQQSTSVATNVSTTGLDIADLEDAYEIAELKLAAKEAKAVLDAARRKSAGTSAAAAIGLD
ncbi:hypothetical protein LTR78_003969 [Recurvomyces mirabilis]|uniref:C3H1-type domain-containing protein n=1 Tax=Recurvomyces mirabilis TaxID=574656 RepID=A0AAE0WQN3_9PEZI|nr:hypothetical protein LTR78_003969 [Recurvomyces mirabilis]KAK5153893.1 hypothetical protein LTS14_007113 [Recurvomyces mirabilis]